MGAGESERGGEEGTALHISNVVHCSALHCNTAPTPAFISVFCNTDLVPQFCCSVCVLLSSLQVVFTIHNMNYGEKKLAEGASYCQKFTTVSPTYAFEVGSHPAIAGVWVCVCGCVCGAQYLGM